jgi:hypothetical protein
MNEKPDAEQEPGEHSEESGFLEGEIVEGADPDAADVESADGEEDPEHTLGRTMWTKTCCPDDGE